MKSSAFVLTAAAVCLICVFSLMYSAGKTPALPSLESETGGKAALSQQQQDHTEYILGIWDGRLAVFAANSQQPLLTTDTLVADLPAADAEALKNGITVVGYESLRALLEDYTS